MAGPGIFKKIKKGWGGGGGCRRGGHYFTIFHAKSFTLKRKIAIKEKGGGEGRGGEGGGHPLLTPVLGLQKRKIVRGGNLLPPPFHHG